MSYLIFVFITLFIGIFKEIFKKNILGKIEPIQFVIIFYFFMFIIAQFTLSKVFMPNLIEFGLIFLAAFFYSMSNLLGLTVLKRIDISLFKPILSFENIIVFMLSFLILGEVLNLMQLFGMFFILLPMVYLSIREFKKHKIKYKDLIYIFLAMLFSAFTGILDKLILVEVNSVTYFYFLKLFTVLIVGSYYLFSYKDISFNMNYLKLNYLKIAFLSVFTAIGTYSYFYALENPISNIIVVKLVLATSAFVTTIVGGKYFHEHDLKAKSIVALFGVVGLSLLVLY